ncbi:DUF6192 family protein [Streptomyces anulatus]|uniref:DUF6192 family protein n=1 Tax=Streptomyces anulatus TaxID=1892 RepID=UPI0033FDBA9F
MHTGPHASRTPRQATPPEVVIAKESEVLTVLGLCHSFSHGIGRALPGLHLAQLSEDAQGSIREGLERVTAAVGWTEHVLETGQTDMDAALERLIAGERRRSASGRHSPGAGEGVPPLS